jgi:hypothetical protein
VYLSDVGRVGKNQYLEELRESRYFTRGWTLQEMLAAEEVHFFDCNWGHMGQLYTEIFAKCISEIKGIFSARPS